MGINCAIRPPLLGAEHVIWTGDYCREILALMKTVASGNVELIP